MDTTSTFWARPSSFASTELRRQYLVMTKRGLFHSKWHKQPLGPARVGANAQPFKHEKRVVGDKLRTGKTKRVQKHFQAHASTKQSSLGCEVKPNKSGAKSSENDRAARLSSSPSHLVHRTRGNTQRGKGHTPLSAPPPYTSFLSFLTLSCEKPNTTTHLSPPCQTTRSSRLCSPPSLHVLPAKATPQTRPFTSPTTPKRQT